MASQMGTATGNGRRIGLTTSHGPAANSFLAKLEAVTGLVKKLTTDLDKKSLSAKGIPNVLLTNHQLLTI